MPTVLRIEGYRFFFWSNEGLEPPHVHVEKGGGYGKLWLDPVRVGRAGGFSPPELRRAVEIVEQNEQFCLEQWRDYFGP